MRAGGGDAGSPRTRSQEQGAQGAVPAPGGGDQELAAGARMVESNQTHPTWKPRSCGASGAQQGQGWDSFFPPGGGGGAGGSLIFVGRRGETPPEPERLCFSSSRNDTAMSHFFLAPPAGGLLPGKPPTFLGKVSPALRACGRAPGRGFSAPLRAGSAGRDLLLGGRRQVRGARGPYPALTARALCRILPKRNFPFGTAAQRHPPGARRV